MIVFMILIVLNYTDYKKIENSETSFLEEYYLQAWRLLENFARTCCNVMNENTFVHVIETGNKRMITIQNVSIQLSLTSITLNPENLQYVLR